MLLNINHFIKKNFLFLAMVLISGCSTSTRIKNIELDTPLGSESYSLLNHKQKSNDIKMFLSFSGGGTRAAAFSYGVLETLRDTEISYNNETSNMLSQVDVISSISGGSFTSAYYGLYGNKIFDDFEKDVLKRDIQKDLVSGLLNPLNWFKFTNSGFDRTELAINYYDEHIFKGATFADFRKDMPFIQINATDLSGGQSFIFKQEYFNLLCSDLSQFKISRAVAASSAVPVAFAPITLKNYENCGDYEPTLSVTEIKDSDNFRSKSMKESLARYLDKQSVKYVHLVDGGIADNLGVRVLYDTVNIIGGVSELNTKMDMKPPRYMVVIIVNAAVSPEKEMDGLPDEPPLGAQVDAVTSAQIDRYSLESIQLMKDSLTKWTAKLSKDSGNEVKPFFIQIDFKGLQDKQQNMIANKVSTSLALPAEQVDGLRKAARLLLTESPEFQKLIAELNHGK
ncbi:MAG: patatin-like phospholipase family protein [Gammaproteobacteria bacterium]|nr:patatin-like phospholipase family protein [Gammaproteobacteria bacterium]